MKLRTASKYVSNKSFFVKEEKSKNTTVYLKPHFLAEVQFAEWTAQNLLRQASFKGLREDKKVKEVVQEEVKNENEIEGIVITNPQKIVFAKEKITKFDLVQYYNQVAEYMLPYVQNRFLSVVRCPQGTKQCFFKKHPTQKMAGIHIKTITNQQNKKETYFYIQEKKGIIAEAQMGTIEFHTWGSKIQQFNQPDVMVFDLDPDEKLSLNQVRQGVKDLKQILDDLSLISFLKTSGNKGYHVVIPFVAKVKWEKFRDFANQIAQLMEQKWPERYTSNMRKSQRKNKIYIDWVRNTKGATSVAPYSVRIKNGCVSMPISYQELDKVTPNQFNLFNAIKQIQKKDPWEQFFKVSQTLS